MRVTKRQLRRIIREAVNEQSTRMKWGTQQPHWNSRPKSYAETHIDPGSDDMYYVVRDPAAAERMLSHIDIDVRGFDDDSLIDLLEMEGLIDDAVAAGAVTIRRMP